MTPYIMQNLVYEWVDFSKFSLIWAKSLEKLGDFPRGDFALNVTQNEQIGI